MSTRRSNKSPGPYFAQYLILTFSDIQFRRNQTKTSDKEPLSDFARDYLEKNTLSYEIDFYWFTRQLFNERVKALGITPSTNLDT